MSPRVWLTWERHRRSRELAEALDCDLLEVVSGASRPWKYGPLLARTVAQLFARRPGVVFVQCPSVVLGVLVISLRPLLGYQVVLDLHNECVEPFNYDGRLYRTVLRRLWRSADVCVVTNAPLARVIDGKARDVRVLPDRIPRLLPAARDAREKGQYSVVFICTYAPDEPYRAVIESARRLPREVLLHVTGNPRRADLPVEMPANVRIRGFLPEPEYEGLLRDADVLVDLTDMDNCLVCGAYEAVALEKPLVTSDTMALRDYFSLGTVYTRHDPEALGIAIQQALASRSSLAAEMRELRVRLEERWETERADLLASLHVGSGR